MNLWAKKFREFYSFMKSLNIFRKLRVYLAFQKQYHDGNMIELLYGNIFQYVHLAFSSPFFTLTLIFLIVKHQKQTRGEDPIKVRGHLWCSVNNKKIQALPYLSRACPVRGGEWDITFTTDKHSIRISGKAKGGCQKRVTRG